MLEQAATAALRADLRARVELWAEDEHRLGLKPILRRVWAKRGRRPIAVVRPRYQWLYVVSFVHPQTGRTVWWTVSKLDAAVFSALLRAFAEELGLGPTRQVLLVLDGAGWHTAGDVVCPPGVELLLLPAYSPELQPAEHLWEVVDEGLVNQCFLSLAALQAVLDPHLVFLTTQTESIRALTLFVWWPLAAHPPPV